MKVVVGGRIPKNILKRYFRIDPDSRLLEARGFDFARREISIRDKRFNLHFWILNAPFIDSDRSALYYGAFALIVFFQKNNKRSFKEVSRWVKACDKHSGKEITDYPKDCLVLLGLANTNEIVTSEKGLALAQKLGMVYYETTPNTTESTRILSEIFTKMAEAYLNYVEAAKAKDI
jgi:hypothetical protein